MSTKTTFGSRVFCYERLCVNDNCCNLREQIPLPTLVFSGYTTGRTSSTSLTFVMSMLASRK